MTLLKYIKKKSIIDRCQIAMNNALTVPPGPVLIGSMYSWACYVCDLCILVPVPDDCQYVEERTIFLILLSYLVLLYCAMHVGSSSPGTIT
jgi:hypothetical protein